jgi:hypothetical protein
LSTTEKGWSEFGAKKKNNSKIDDIFEDSGKNAKKDAEKA